MKTFRDAVSEVETAFKQLAFFEIVLNSLIVFLASYLVLLLFDIGMIFALIPTVVYVVIFSVRKLKTNSASEVESKYGSLKEKFRTAVESQYVENPVVNELQAEVLRDLRKVEEASFFNDKQTYIKAGVIILLCFLIFYFSPVSLTGLFNFDLSKILPSDTNSLKTGTGSSDPGAYTGGMKEGGNLFGDEDIYGKLSVAKLGDKMLEVKFNPGGYEMNINEVKDVEEIVFDESYPTEITASSGEILEENIPQEQQELVKNYFKKLAEEG
jgi:ABC-type multidrug transport system fused ATPase/permease subunit